MILICSDEKEPSTDIVCSWLNYYNKKFIRISYLNAITIKRLLLNNLKLDIVFDIDDIEYRMSDFSSYWYRRSNLNFKFIDKIKVNFEDVDISNEVNYFIEEEYHKVKELFKIRLAEISKLNIFNDNHINKLNTLYQASKLGIEIPKTIIAENFIGIKREEKKWITKPISDLIIDKDGTSYFSTTKRVEDRDLKNTSLSMIQTEVEKKFEIRSFFFNNTFYSSAIFSQQNSKTELDFRNYDTENPNRVVPYKLPSQLEAKLIKLSRVLNLKSGSFDIAYTNDNKYILFEVNPVGQFEQVSFPCNYQIHQQIAKFL
jgi:ATP-GRASP peptide maturase of grasp-with-spasm system